LGDGFLVELAPGDAVLELDKFNPKPSLLEALLEVSLPLSAEGGGLGFLADLGGFLAGDFFGDGFLGDGFLADLGGFLAGDFFGDGFFGDGFLADLGSLLAGDGFWQT
jgi:hypothetical protein